MFRVGGFRNTRVRRPGVRGYRIFHMHTRTTSTSLTTPGFTVQREPTQRTARVSISASWKVPYSSVSQVFLTNDSTIDCHHHGSAPTTAEYCGWLFSSTVYEEKCTHSTIVGLVGQKVETLCGTLWGIQKYIIGELRDPSLGGHVSDRVYYWLDCLRWTLLDIFFHCLGWTLRCRCPFDLD